MMTLPLTVFIALMIAFQVKHFLCDYTFQIHKDAPNKGHEDLLVWFMPLAKHSVAHGLGTFVVVRITTTWLGIEDDTFLDLQLFAADVGLHFLVDRMKAHKRLGGRWGIAEKMFWVALGFDQFAHHIINIGFACYIIATLFIH